MTTSHLTAARARVFFVFSFVFNTITRIYESCKKELHIENHRTVRALGQSSGNRKEKRGEGV